MSGGWERFAETFFNTRVMLKYLPDILSGVVITIELAVLIVVAGIAAGLALALLRSLAIRPLNWLIIGVVDLTRKARQIAATTYEPLPPFVAAAVLYGLALALLVAAARTLERSLRRR